MKIEILGTGCKKCSQLFENASKAAKDSGKQIEIVKVTDLGQIMSYGVMSTPALVVDGKVVSSGRVESPESISQWL